MSMGDVKIEIDRRITDGTFTNYDIIKGSVTLVVTNSISLNWIQVKLEGVSSSQLSIPRVASVNSRRRDRDKKDKIVRDVHKILYDTAIVFPPDNVRQVSQAKEFTLTPGNYSYPFEFKIPLNNSCVKMTGITNKVTFNSKTFDVMINNGNFNPALIQNKAQQLYSDYISGTPPSTPGSSQAPPQQQQQHSYHITSQLPPSLSGNGEFASIKYYVKVTCKRSSFFKTNLRAFDPFIFLPLDLDEYNRPLNTVGGDYEEYREVFVRKELIFKNRIPEIVGVKIPPPAPPSKSEPPTKDVPFSFEIRFRHPAFLIPTKRPSFKLFLISNLNPDRYSLAKYERPEESNGLGVVYLQRLTIDLICTTAVSVLETDGNMNETHMGKNEERINICNNNYQNLKFDLRKCKINKKCDASNVRLYELEIPKKYFENCILPDYLAPSFKTCNISRKYTLVVTGGFSAEKIVDFKNSIEVNKKIKYVDLDCQNIKVLSGLRVTSHLQSNASRSSTSIVPPLPDRKQSQTPPVTGSSTSPVPPPSAHSTGDDSASYDSSPGGDLPTYDDVMRESSYQNDSEHQRARRRYRQHEQYYNNLE
ncbi:uncharacterized protein SPAPADRAFT_73455 [Spathaspora passalidarum NRRL Y-27907]|uniref:Arrestin-like N-terminal domain-containing protein n=1 Tax=Spathaspora passalidarum (strain NRRL Y-27907 / 11-Y1) TaxID=619300 RepID=G3AUU1_SPAPN|nr:uncharacterized protein SPAPADRAFT_73455 [Spathaspora passalidarum NRRL Y-27907]EGW30032.1 hypothetical protein SPAPADRAFT_73455 [Spathaspora passalidarum NRRL Y-27907]